VKAYSPIFLREPKIRKLFKRQNGKCYYCGCEMRMFRKTGPHPLPPDYATKDHVIPRSKGGVGNIGNLVAACNKCNMSRSSMDAQEFKASLATDEGGK
jgi:5-methylcytosine-specific restriction endonuclease McrA